jgi:glycosyltransferase involved in cell wall biosynthesis
MGISARPMKVAFIMATLGTGGVGRMRIHLTRYLAEHGLDTTLLLGSLDSPYMEAVHPEVRVSTMRGSHFPLSIPALMRYLWRERPDALVTDRVRVNRSALWARRISGLSTRVFTSVHIPISLKLKGLKAPKRSSVERAIQASFPWNDGIIVNSKGVARDLLGRFDLAPQKLHVIYNPVITEDMFAKAREVPAHPWLQEGRDPVILGVGRLEKPKDFQTLLRAFARLQGKRPAKLMILGDGKEMEELKGLAEKLGIGSAVSFAGFAMNPYGCMARARVVALSSRWEGFGNVLVEALALGTPVVATDCDYGPREILAGGRYGRLVPVGDVEAMAKAIDETLDQPKDTDLFRTAAEDFTLDRCGARYMEVLGFRPHHQRSSHD